MNSKIKIKRKLHIVSFDVPYPPNYGGIIDVFYRIKELHKLGIDIYLHCYLYNHKKTQPTLDKYCKQIFYYHRKNYLISLFSTLPFRLVSRKNKDLYKNLQKIGAPIIFEGINTIYPLYKYNLQNCYVRTHNIEDKYFYGLAKSEKNLLKKYFYYLEAYKLKRFESNLNKAEGIFTISPFEQEYFLKKLKTNTYYLPAFHNHSQTKNHLKKGDFILFHGDLRVADNIRACEFLIDTYKNTPFKFVIATSLKKVSFFSTIEKYDNISITKIDGQDDLNMLFEKAHINTLFTFQKTGIKLKLLNALYKGKFIISNSLLVEDTGLESLCEIANTKKEILTKTNEIFMKDFETREIDKRIEKLKLFSPEISAKKMVDLIFKNH